MTGYYSDRHVASKPATGGSNLDAHPGQVFRPGGTHAVEFSKTDTPMREGASFSRGAQRRGAENRAEAGSNFTPTYDHSAS